MSESKSISTDSIMAYLDEIQRRYEALDRRHDDLFEQAAKIEQQMALLQGQAEAAHKMLEMAENGGSSTTDLFSGTQVKTIGAAKKGKKQSRSGSQPRPTGGRKSGATATTDVVKAYVKTYPGMLPHQIADALIEKIDTSSKNPRRVVKSTIVNLVKRGDLESRDDGVYLIERNGRE